MDYGELKSNSQNPAFCFSQYTGITCVWGQNAALRWILYNKYNLLFYDFKKV